MMAILAGNGDGTFQGHIDYTVGTESAGMLAGDFNDDRTSDIIVGSVGDDMFSALLSTPVIAIYTGSVSFRTQTVGTTSPPKTVRLSNPGSVPIALHGVHITGADS